jgi:hypothetical protein
MGLFDRWRGKGKSSRDKAFESLLAEMTEEAVVIVTRERGTYTVYWVRNNESPATRGATVCALKRSSEGHGPSAFEAILESRRQADRQSKAAQGRSEVVVAKATIKTVEPPAP